MKLIAGLGNPGRRYEHTRHNAGFMVLDRLAQRERLTWRNAWRTSASKTLWRRSGEDAMLVKPLSYMNRSGGPVQFFLKKVGNPCDDMIVVYDDLDLDVGRLRVRPRGTAGGHNGMKSIIDAIGTDDFVRIRVGIGGSEPSGDRVSYVLAPFSSEERRSLDGALDRAIDAIGCVLDDGVEAAMNQFNGT